MNAELDFQAGGCIDSFLWFFFREKPIFSFDHFAKILRKILSRKCFRFEDFVQVTLTGTSRLPLNGRYPTGGFFWLLSDINFFINLKTF